MKMAMATVVVAAWAVFAPVPVAHGNSSGVISEAQATDVKVSLRGAANFGSFNFGLPMNSRALDKERETSSWLAPKGTTPPVAWVVALGFLGLVVMRRTRQQMP